MVCLIRNVIGGQSLKRPSTDFNHVKKTDEHDINIESTKIT